MLPLDFKLFEELPWNSGVFLGIPTNFPRYKRMYRDGIKDWFEISNIQRNYQGSSGQ